MLRKLFFYFSISLLLSYALILGERENLACIQIVVYKTPAVKARGFSMISSESQLRCLRYSKFDSRARSERRGGRRYKNKETRVYPAVTCLNKYPTYNGVPSRGARARRSHDPRWCSARGGDRINRSGVPMTTSRFLNRLDFLISPEQSRLSSVAFSVLSAPAARSAASSCRSCVTCIIFFSPRPNALTGPL